MVFPLCTCAADKIPLQMHYVGGGVWVNFQMSKAGLIVYTIYSYRKTSLISSVVT